MEKEIGEVEMEGVMGDEEEEELEKEMGDEV